MNAFFKHALSRLGKLLVAVALIVTASGFTAAPARAQDDASIAGTVLDASGAAIEAVTIRITNVETGKQRELQTDDAGRFHALSLTVGRYDLAAEKSGFRSEKRAGITLVVGQREELDLTLFVG